MITGIHCWISGRVQGVFFRASTLQIAQKLDLEGWVRNLPDGRVEVWAYGDPQAIKQLQEWLLVGPPMARVDNIITKVAVKDPEPDAGFRFK